MNPVVGFDTEIGGTSSSGVMQRSLSLGDPSLWIWASGDRDDAESEVPMDSPSEEHLESTLRRFNLRSWNRLIPLCSTPFMF